MDNNYSDYIVYVDESGDHGLIKIDLEHPVFTLVFCIFKKSDYADTVKNIIDLKFKYFSSDMVVLHEMDIRRRKGVFKGFNKASQDNLNNDLAQIVENNDFTLIATVIKKQELLNKYKEAENPYHIAMGYCLERLYHFLKDNNNHEKQIDVVVESRGKNEDDELELEFRRWCGGDNYFQNQLIILI
jgi:hypothetical protein